MLAISWRTARRVVDRDDLRAIVYSSVIAARVIGAAAVAGLSIRIVMTTSGLGGAL